MDSPRHLRGLVAISSFSGGPIGFDRWSAALIEALSVAAAPDLGWRILVGDDGSAGPASEDVLAAEKSARDAGGGLSVVSLGTGEDRLASLSDLVDEDDALVLTVASDALILPSTVRRLLRAHSVAGGAVAARTLPFEEPTAPTPACVLAADFAAASSDAASCPEAVIARVPREERANIPDTASPGSLLEDAARAGTSSDAAATLIAETLGIHTDPLLSIVMRTQLRRPEALRDVLLCLAAQTDGRFELLLVVHDGDVTGVEALLGEQPAWLRQRARVLTATGGTRSRPLNVGLAAAQGTLVAVLDDDDVVTAYWVASFLDAAAIHPRRLLRAVVGVQQVSTAEWPDGIAGHAATSEVTVPYPAAFDLADHLRVNMTPFMALAFPRAVLELLGGADETLEVCEDWDLVLRTAALLGVVDIPHLTAVYRRWTSGDDSYSLHDEEVWRRDMQKVRAKLDAGPLLLPAGSASALAAMSQLRADPSELAEVYGSTSWRVTAPLRAVSRLVHRMRRRTRGAAGTSG